MQQGKIKSVYDIWNNIDYFSGEVGVISVQFPVKFT